MKINTKRTQNRHRTTFSSFKKECGQKFFSVKYSQRTKFFSVKMHHRTKNTLCKTADGQLYLPCNPSFVGDMYKTYYSAKTQLVFLFFGKAVS